MKRFFSILVIGALSGATPILAAVKLQALQGKAFTQVSWFYTDKAPQASVILQRRCEGDKDWKNLASAIPLSLEAGKKLDWLPVDRQAAARAAFQNALDNHNLSGPVGGDSLMALWRSESGVMLAGMLFGQNPELAMYAGLSFADTKPGRECQYGLRDGADKKSLATVAAVKPEVKILSPYVGSRLYSDDKASIHWQHRFGAQTSNALVGFSAFVLDAKGKRMRTLFENVNSMSGDDSCRWTAPLDSFPSRKTRVALVAEMPGLGVLDEVVFTATLPYTNAQSQALNPKVQFDVGDRKGLSWVTQHFFGDSVVVDSTVIEMRDSDDSLALRKVFKGLHAKGGVAVPESMRGEEWGDHGLSWRVNLQFHSGANAWGPYESVHVPASYEVQEDWNWHPEVFWDPRQPHVLRIPLKDMPTVSGKMQRVLVVDRTLRIPYDKAKGYGSDPLALTIPKDHPSSSVQLCEQYDGVRHCAYVELPVPDEE